MYDGKQPEKCYAIKNIMVFIIKYSPMYVVYITMYINGEIITYCKFMQKHDNFNYSVVFLF